MAEWPEAIKEELHYGVQETSPGGQKEVVDYYYDQPAARQDATMTPQPGHKYELVKFTVTYSAAEVIANPLEAGPK